MSKYLVTSALPYANGPIHLGHLAGAYLPADIFVRFLKQNGDDVVYICGTDEHGVPVTIRAEQEKTTPREVVDRYHRIIDDSFVRMGIAFDNFSGTARPKHAELSQRIFSDLFKNGFINTKTEKQFFDEQTNRFLPDRYVEGTCPKCGFIKARGDQCDKCGSLLDALELIDPKSIISKTKPVIRETKHWYLKLQDFEKKLKDWIGSKEWKENVKNFVLSWIKTEGLRERAITRDIDWGIPVPLDDAKGKVLYVWFDAPIGYISSTVEWAERIGQPERWKDYWFDKDTRLVHFIGKDNIPFHAIIWPAILMGQDQPFILPYDIPANEYLTLEGEKFSTSNNWAVWVNDYLDEFPPDPLRFFLASNAPESKDADFSWKAFQEKNNEELANILGNFANRSLTFIQNYLDGKTPESKGYTADDDEVFKALSGKISDLTKCFTGYKVREASKTMMDIARIGNKYFDDQKPWALRKDSPERLSTVMNVCMNILRVLAVAMSPIVPFSAEKLWKMLGEKGEVTAVKWSEVASGRVAASTPIGKPEILFVKYEDETIQKQIDKLTAQSKKQKEGVQTMADTVNTPNIAPEQPVAETGAQITIDEFRKLDIRIAEVIEAVPMEKSKKLIKLKVRVGEDEKQILAGIKEFYDPANLVGKKIVILNNLVPTKLMGEESQGMLLAASNADKSALSVLTLERDVVPSGAKIS